MLSFTGNIILIVLLIVSIVLTAIFSNRIFRLLKASKSARPYRKLSVKERFKNIVSLVILQRKIFSTRKTTYFFHLVLLPAFIVYSLAAIEGAINIINVQFHFFQNKIIQSIYLSSIDISGIAVLIVVIYFLIRRVTSSKLKIGKVVISKSDENTNLQRFINIDSFLVLLFLFTHIASSLLHFSLKKVNLPEDLMLFTPFGDLISDLYFKNNESSESIANMSFFVSNLSLIVFLPYFFFSKHMHLIFATINLVANENATLNKISYEKFDINDIDLESLNTERIEDLDRSEVLDALSCIKCNRCQDVCPAFQSGSGLSPSVLEVKKRSVINRYLKGAKNFDEVALQINKDELWDCTTCGACIEICPVGNTPLNDISRQRRSKVLLKSQFPSYYKNTFDNIEKTGNPFGIKKGRIEAFKEGTRRELPTVQDNPNFEYLVWMGCSGYYDIEGQKTALALVSVLESLRINYAVLGDEESCTGESIKNMGNEYLFALLTENIKTTFDKYNVSKVITPCPHCYNTFKNIYPKYGFNLSVRHSIDFLRETFKPSTNKTIKTKQKIAIHDSCIMSRYNSKFDEHIREILDQPNFDIIELKNKKRKAVCCGAGGGNYFNSENKLETNNIRVKEITGVEIDILVTSCPFCKNMFKHSKGLKSIDIKDIVELCNSI